MQNSSERTLKARAGAGVIPWVILVFCLIASFFLWTKIRESQQLYLQERFDAEVSKDIQSVTERMKTYEQVLYATTGLFRASKSVEREEFRAFYEGLNLEEHLAGIQALGYSEFIGSKEEVTAFENALQQEGFADFQVRPQTDRNEYHAIKFIEPFNERNRLAFGFDMHSEAVRSEAMDRARSSGRSALSGKVTLLQEGNLPQQAGTLLYVPIYRNGMPVETEPERRQAFVGFAYAPFRMNDLMAGIFSKETLYQVDFAIYDGDTTASGSLLYTNEHEEEEGYAPLFHDHQIVEIAGRTWLIDFHSSEFFDKSHSYVTSYALLIAGIALSVLIFLISRFIYEDRDRAVRLASGMTAKLQEREAAMKLLTDHIPSGILYEDINRKIQYVNKKLLFLLGINTEVSDILGKDVREEIREAKTLFADPVAFEKRLNQIITKKAPVLSEQLTLADGRIYERDCIPIFVGTEFKGFLRQYRDVTENKKFEKELAQKNEELERMNALMVGRELEMAELKKKDGQPSPPVS